MRKKITDEQLEKLGGLCARMCADATEAWNMGIKALPINGLAFQRIEKVKHALNIVRLPLVTMATERGWTDEKIKAIFAPLAGK